jgi:hypothetical protein
MAGRPSLAAAAASNTFRVRDPAALRALLEPHGVRVTLTARRRVRLALENGLPFESRDPHSGRQITLDLPALIASQLEAGEIVVLKEIRTTARDVGGTALAFDHRGATVTVDLEEITFLAAELTRSPAPL